MTSFDPHSASDEVEFLHEAIKDNKVITFDNEIEEVNGNAQAACNYTPPFMLGFRLLDLPAEIRYHVWAFLIPHNVVITFERCGWLNYDEPEWITNGFTKGEDVPSSIGGNPFHRNTRVRRSNHFTVETQLFLVSQFVSNEARCKLFS
jgi:hypothetical protein